jgi:hypothetical protein
MLLAGGPLSTLWVHYTTCCNTQPSVLEVGQNNCPKHVELTGFFNKLLLLHLVGCPYYLYQWCMLKQISDNEIHLLIKYIKSLLWRVAKRLSYIQEAWCIILMRVLLKTLCVHHECKQSNLNGAGWSTAVKILAQICFCMNIRSKWKEIKLGSALIVVSWELEMKIVFRLGVVWVCTERLAVNFNRL